MSFLAKFIIDGKDYNVLESVYALHQPTDEVGKPIGRPRGGKITLKLESDGNTDLFHWMKEPSVTKGGSIIFFKRDAMAKQMVIEFENAFCVDFMERFVADNNAPMITSIVISAQSIKVGSVDFKNLWGVES
jgi:hypothetical protein